MRTTDLSIGLGSICFGLLLFYYSTTLPAIPGQIYGADAFPRLISMGFMVCGIICAWRSFRVHRRIKSRASMSFLPAAQIGGLSAAIITFTYFAEKFGYLASSFLLLLSIMLAQRTRWWPAVLAAAIIAGGTYVIFVYLLRVPLPEFQLEF